MSEDPIEDGQARPRDARLARPLRLAPRFVERIWGGRSLPAFHGLGEATTGPRGDGGTGGHAAAAPSSRGGLGAPGAAPHDTATAPIGESWLLGDDNVVTGGSLAGRTVRELAATFGAALLGTANTSRYGDKLALLAKFLDAEQDLSLQVHPDDAYALAHEAATGHLGKAEAWYVLEAQPGASVVWGFKRDVTAAEVRAAVDRGDLVSLMNRLPVAAGDVVVNPAGTVHAVGAGVMLFEIQQSSDLTYRLFDYDRRDAAGRPRELHVDKALAVADLSRSLPGEMVGRLPPQAVEPNRWRRLVELPEFVLDVAELGGHGAAGRVDDATKPESLELLVVTRGGVTVRASGDAPVEAAGLRLRRGDAVLLPATLGAYGVEGLGEVVRSAIVKRLGG